jgi:hypothetical protein
MEIDSGGEEKKMPNHQIQDLITQIKVGAVAYVRNLAVAEDAVQKGQFSAYPTNSGYGGRKAYGWQTR